MRHTALIGLLSACGRFGFDNSPAGDAAGSGSDAAVASVFTAFALPAGGTASSISRAPDGTMYVALGDDAIRMMSSPDGTSWTDCGDTLHNDELQRVAIDASGTIYVAADREILVSRDKCATWQATGFADDPHGIDFFNGMPLAGGLASGLRVYTGGTWTPFTSQFVGQDVEDVVVVPGGQTIFVANPGGIWRTTNAGGSWTNVYSGGDIELLWLDPSDTQHLIAESYNSGTLLVTGNQTTWTPAGEPGFALAFDPTHSGQVVQSAWSASGDQESGDFGQSWSAADARSAAMHVATTSHFLFDPNGHLWAATGRGVFYSNDYTMASWSERDAGISGWTIQSITVGETGTIFLGTSAGVLQSSNFGASWTEVSTGLARNSLIMGIVQKPGDPNTIVVATGAGDIAVSSDQGSSYGTPPAYSAGASDLYHLDDVIIAGGNLFGAMWAGIERSDSTWSGFVHVDLGTATHHARRVFDASGTGAQLLVAAEDGVFYSINSGASFGDDNTGLDAAGALDVRGFAKTPDGVFFACTAAGVYTGAASGPWTRTALDSTACNDLLTIGSKLVAATDSGVEVTSDDGATWTALPGLEQRWPSRLALDTMGRLLVGTDGYGAYYTTAP